MTTKVARYIQEMGAADLLFVNRTLAKAEPLAEKFGGKAVSLDDFRRQPQAVAAIISATAAIEPVFGADFLARLPHGSQPIICVDLAIPRDFADVFGHTDAVRLVDIHDLKSRAQGNLRQKFVEASKADEIVRQSVSRFLSDCIEVSLKPIFHDSYRASLDLAREAIDDLFAKRKSTLPAEEKERVMRLVTRLVGQSAFQPARILADRREMLLVRKDSFTGEGALPVKISGVVGTSSNRRKCQVAHLNPSVKIEDLRGNVPTRVRKLRDGQYDAIMIAAAGVTRLELDVSDLEVRLLDPELFLPAPAQGILGIQIRTDNDRVESVVSKLGDRKAAVEASLERGLLSQFESGCSLPLGVYSEVAGADLRLKAVLGRLDGDSWTGLTTVDLTGSDPDQVVDDAFSRLNREA